MLVDSTSNIVFNKYMPIDDSGWKKGDTVFFELPLLSNEADLEITISVRYTNRYPYQNLQLMAFLAELDTANIINSLPIRQNDDIIDSLIHRRDSLNQEKERSEEELASRASQADSSAPQSTAISAMANISGNRNDSIYLAAIRQDSLTRDSIRRAKAKEQEAMKEHKAKAARDSISAMEKDLTHTIDFILFNEDDRSNGHGMMFVENEMECGTIHLKANTRYKIMIFHNMTDRKLRGISDVGVELKRSDKPKEVHKNTKWDQ